MQGTYLSKEEMSSIEREILSRAVEKLNYVYTFGRGESLTSEESSVFEYWRKKGRVKAIGPAKFGEIFQIVEPES
ncbi:MAG TPA: hypothetical protein VFF30_01980 [Nitrososphaerales archaeon]|nr:hypothetical protein [Nitrososphaerales archaeon]